MRLFYKCWISEYLIIKTLFISVGISDNRRGAKGVTAMGIYIHLTVSASVTQREWEKVYQETFQLVKAFHLAELLRENNCIICARQVVWCTLKYE